MSKNLAEMPYHQLVNCIMQCKRKVERPNCEGFPSPQAWQAALEQEQQRRLRNFFSISD